MGNITGWLEGCIDGDMDGCLDGFPDGCEVGSVGISVGISVGATDAVTKLGLLHNSRAIRRTATFMKVRRDIEDFLPFPLLAIFSARIYYKTAK